MKKEIILAAFLAMAGSQAKAQISAVNSAAVLPVTDTINWGQLGSTFTQLTSPQTVTSVGGLSASVSDAGTLERRDEGNGWNGNFTLGDHLLWNQVDLNPITITFATPVTGAGALIQSDQFGAFVATLSAYNSLGVLLGTETFNGDSTSAGDGSAIFAGLDSTSADISKISFSANNQGVDFAIDTLDLNAGGKVGNSVPDAGFSSLMLGASLAGLGFLRRKLQ
jgi:hypothetical protein